MEFFEITINQHYRHEPYHNVSGYELEVVRNDKEQPGYMSEEYNKEQLERSYNHAIEKMNEIAQLFKEKFYLKDIERFKDERIIRVVDWYSIGD